MTFKFGVNVLHLQKIAVFKHVEYFLVVYDVAEPDMALSPAELKSG